MQRQIGCLAGHHTWIAEWLALQHSEQDAKE